MSHPTLLVIAGVSGSGKTTIGLELAQRLNVSFLDGDDLHSASNIDRMRSGTPLEDSDREPWLCHIKERAIELLEGMAQEPRAVVIACSALKRKHRDILRGTFENQTSSSPHPNLLVHFLYLKTQPELIRQRLRDRKNHFAGVDLLLSQMNTLQQPDPDQEDTNQSKVIILTLISETGQPKPPKELVDEAIHQLSTKTQAPIMTTPTYQQPFSNLPNLQMLFEAESEKLLHVLSLLFEVSNSIEEKLIPALKMNVKEKPLNSYDELITRCENLIHNEFSLSEQVNFLSSHPRIGEVNNLSKLSSKEQGNVTDLEVLARLKELNILYEEVYPGLRYVTFVNGRTRREIVQEMEALLFKDGAPPKEKHQQDQEWYGELERGVADVFKIARSRLKSLNEHPTS